MSGWVRSLLKVSVVVFSLLAAVGVAVYITIMVLVPQETVVVPRVVGKEFKQAVLLLSRSELSTRVIREEFSTEIPADIVISQTPPPGTKVQENRNVDLVISGGAEMVTTPDVVGMKLREAKMSVSELGIGVATISYARSETPQGEVIAQDPSAGSRLARDTGVNLLISTGSGKPKLMMPDLRGEKINEVAKWLQEVSINPGMIKQESSSKEEGTIISQSPPPGSIIDKEDRVKLVVSGRREEGPRRLSPPRWVLTSVQVPLGLSEKKVSVVIIDEEGRRSLDYGMYPPGEKVWVSCEVVGGGEIKVYVNDRLVKIERVKK